MKNKFNKLICLKLNIALIGLSLSTQVFAQHFNDDDIWEMSPEQLANILVTIASGTEKPAYQSAAVTTVITAEQIKTMGATELPEILETVPGLHVRIQGVTNDAVYSMRGIRNDVNNQVLIMLNGTRFSVPYKGSTMSGMLLPVEAIQRIEVIRGPGSALYGADAFAGVINIITKNAKDFKGTEIGIRGGSSDTQSIWGMHSNHWQGWDVAATLQYAHNNNDDDRRIKADAQTLFDTTLGTNVSSAPGEMQTNSERWNTHLNLQRKFVEMNFWAFNSDGGLRSGAGGALDKEGSLEGENYLADIRFSTEDFIEDWEIKAHANYLYTDIDVNVHNFPDGTILPIDANGNVNLLAPAGLSFFPNGMRTKIGIENQVVAAEVSSLYKGIENHLLRLSVGFRYEQTLTKEKRNYGKGILNGTQAIVNSGLANVTGTDLVFLPDSHRSIWSVAIQDEWKITEAIQLTAGVRYDEYSDFGSTFNPRVALVWEVNDKFNAKLLYGQAFRAPSFLEQKQQNSQLFNGKSSVEPETIETVELAFDFRPTKDIRVASNFYYYEIDDLISVVAENGGASVDGVDNVQGQEGFGTEIEWDWKLNDFWHVKGNYAWQYARDKDMNRRVAGVPEHQVYTSVAWQFVPQWKIQTQMNWVGHRVSPKGDARRLNDYETVDITLNSKRFFGHVDFAASVRNVFDSNGKELATVTYPDSLPIPSRSFYLETTVHF